MNAFDNLTLTVGKHRGETFSDIYENDESYCNWVVKEEYFDNDSLDAFLHYILLRSYLEEHDDVSRPMNYRQPARNSYSQINITIK